MNWCVVRRNIRDDARCFVSFGKFWFTIGCFKLLDWGRRFLGFFFISKFRMSTWFGNILEEVVKRSMWVFNWSSWSKKLWHWWEITKEWIGWVIFCFLWWRFIDSFFVINTFKHIIHEFSKTTWEWFFLVFFKRLVVLKVFTLTPWIVIFVGF